MKWHLVNDLLNGVIIQRNVWIVMQHCQQQSLDLVRLDVSSLVHVVNLKGNCEVLTSQVT